MNPGATRQPDTSRTGQSHAGASPRPTAAIRPSAPTRIQPTDGSESPSSIVSSTPPAITISPDGGPLFCCDPAPSAKVGRELYRGIDELVRGNVTGYQPRLVVRAQASVERKQYVDHLANPGHVESTYGPASTCRIGNDVVADH